MGTEGGMVEVDRAASDLMLVAHQVCVLGGLSAGRGRALNPLWLYFIFGTLS